MHTLQNNIILSLIESRTSSLLKCKALYVDGTPDHEAWTNSETVKYYTNEVSESIANQCQYWKVK